ncbi:MAG: outer membrane receptor protein involved in Fe transport [Flavobacteriaceae bacterium]|jgi:outer membrane receptor protein involved in Fe transport
MRISLLLSTHLSCASFCLFVGLAFPTHTNAQSDTLSQKLFGDKDLVEVAEDSIKFITSANLLSENYEDLPQEVIIIDGDDIRKFGYSTLVDVLKSLPGFRTSQPGNAMEGETFLMRGLYGNEHTKILVNGIPIKPEAVKGMPIAAQLPIRHAERIEIVMGPSSAAYGSDAMAGVINIVFPDVDLPVFAWADVQLMNNQGSEINLTLGGKMGRGKNTLNYQLFASSYTAADQNINFPEDSIRIGQDELIPEQWQLLVTEPESQNIPEIDYLPKESRLIGGNLKFRWFELSFMNMYRSDHSAIGSYPTVSTYHNPNLYVGENISTIALKYQDEKNKRYQSRASLSSVFYRMLPSSSYYGVDHFLSNGNNHMYARSFDIRGEYQGVFKINKQSNLVGGIIGNYSMSHVFTNFLASPIKYDGSIFEPPANWDALTTGAVANPLVDSISDLGSTTYIPTYEAVDVGMFFQYSYTSRSKNFYFVVATRADLIDLVDTAGTDMVFTPKAGIMYRPIANLKLRAFYGSGHRQARSYHLYNHYSEAGPAFVNGAGLKRRTNRNLKAETMQGGEVGATWKPTEAWRVDVSYFIHRMENRVLRQINVYDSTLASPPGAPIKLQGVSYFNGESYSTLGSFMLNINYEKRYAKAGYNLGLSYQFASGTERVEPEENSPAAEVETVPGYRFVPRNMIKANVVIDAFGFTLAINTQFYGDYITEVYRSNAFIEHDDDDNYYFNADISIHKELFRQLSLTASVGNLLNSSQSGIPNVNVSDSWNYNPQYGRTYRLGLIFKLN